MLQAGAAHQDVPIPHFDIDLDAPPKQRWVQVAHYYRERIIAGHRTLAQDYLAVLGPGYKDTWLNAFDWSEYTEYLEEMQGMVDSINDRSVDLDSFKLAHLLYEMGAPTLRGSGASCS